MLASAPRPSDQIAAYFDARARAYDLQLALERAALRTAAALAGPIAGERVVDLASGTGALGAALLARAGSARPAALIAVDASPRMLERARARLGLEATLMVADVRAVDLPDDTADLVTIGYLLHLLSPVEGAAVLAEARRLLRPGGRLVAVVHGSPGGLPGVVYRAGWRALSRLLPRAVVGGGPLADLAPKVAAAGLVVEESRRVPGVYWSQVVRARLPSEPPAQR